MAQVTEADNLNQFDKVYQVVQNSETVEPTKKGDGPPKHKTNSKLSNTKENQVKKRRSRLP